MGKKAVTGTLLDVYHRLLDRYGPQHWWPADSPFEVMIGAILTQSAAWANVEKAINNLKARDVLSIDALHQLPAEELARLIYPSGYYNAKAGKIKALVQWLAERYDGNLDKLLALDIPLLRRELLSVRGVGEETADSIILYAAGKPVFVIDAYTRRILRHLGLTPPTNSYAAFQDLFMQYLPYDEALFNEYHALLVRHGKEACKKVPRCQECCLASLCPTPEKSTTAL
jgi:endonuclease-3 related protein